jgi:hypothetical protein|tara:strand:+ start:713 stop:988 length:276 start_codon:yes stop_codon:yes gene_type:complete
VDALAWAVETPEADLAQRTATALTWFWLSHRHIVEAVSWFGQALALDEGGRTAARAAALVHSGFTGQILRQYDLDSCLAQVREGAAIFAEL